MQAKSFMMTMIIMIVIIHFRRVLLDFTDHIMESRITIVFIQGMGIL